jgi:hypothetical protein
MDDCRYTPARSPVQTFRGVWRMEAAGARGLGCLAALLRQFCSVSAPPYTFAATEFKAEFPRGILDSAVLLLTPREQELIADERPEIVLRKTHLPS